MNTQAKPQTAAPVPSAMPRGDDLATTFDRACAEQAPQFVPITPHVDDRGWSLMNQFQNVLTTEGQINYSLMFPDIIKAWHRHQHQTDFWLCLHGHLKVGVQREADDARWMMVIGEKRPGVVIIPPPLWHGAATVGPDPAGLLYYVTRRYNPDAPDEERRGHDALPDFPWGVRYR